MLMTAKNMALWIRRLISVWVCRYIYFGKYLSIGRNVRIYNCLFGTRNTIYEAAELIDVTIGDCSYVGPRSRLTHAVIGKFSCIAPEVIIGLGKHPARGFVSTHPAFFSPNRQAGFTFVTSAHFEEYAPCSIGHDVWIGARAIVLDGVNIGNGAIVGAGAVVTKDVPPYAIVGGVPAKTLRYRFEPAEIDFLQQFKWWDRDFNWLSEHHKIFHDVKEFCEQIKIHRD